MMRPYEHFPTIAVVNGSTVVEDDAVRAYCKAQQGQIQNDALPAWGLAANVAFSRTPPAWAWRLHVMDDTDQADALGYHETDEHDVPAGFVFAKTDLDLGLEWTVTASHEVLEMLVNPWIGDVILRQRGRAGGTLLLKEVCDPVEADELAYETTYHPGIRLSDFVYPAYWDETPQPGARLDHCGALTAPFSLADGGYCSQFVIGSPDGWTQVFAGSAHAVRRAARAGKAGYSRTARYMRRFDQPTEGD